MILDRMDYNSNTQNIENLCKKYLYYNVTLTLSDGSVLDGMIESVELERIIMLVGEDVIDPDDDENTYDKNRQHGHRGPRRRFRRFRRRSFPFGNVIAIGLLPYIPPHPFLFY